MQEDSAKNLLEAAYSDLGYDEGDLWDATKAPSNIDYDEWIEKGDWLTLANNVDAEKLFFVDNNPVVVFARCESEDAEILRVIYNRIWCMSRPRLLFLAKPGELAVYDLANEPFRTHEDWQKRKTLDVVNSIKDVATKLKQYRREQIETGYLFEEKHFGGLKYRADKSLIQDIKKVREALIAKGLDGEKLKYAHALIGRSIFVRYLEDRKILTREYFYNIAEQDADWVALLDSTSVRPDIDPEMGKRRYHKILGNKDFTYALFNKLAKDFNGDMFPQSDEERNIVSEEHLLELQSFLRGDMDTQKKLLFFAYRFEIIPIELISSIYEEFYHKEIGAKNTKGSFYTPPALVEFLLHHVLEKAKLETKPRVLDPACGSGIFLVEAFRRIVRFQAKSAGRRLNFSELTKILKEQIAGIDINPEAIQVAAFSLYLAMLHYLKPPDILHHIENGDHLPHFLVNSNTQDNVSLNILLTANTFDIDLSIPVSLREKFSQSCADVVVANPPWGDPKSEDKEAREANDIGLRWCASNDYPVGDKERSQTYIWKTIDLLRHGGTAGLLISAGMLFNFNRPTIEFREKFFSSVTVDYIYNFTHTRKFFFKGSNAPFIAVIFKKTEAIKSKNRIHYWSAKRTANVGSLQSVILSRNDLKFIEQSDAMKEHIWKIYWWGNHQDEALIRYLKMNDRLRDLTKPNLVGQGFKKANQKLDANWLKQYKEFPAKSLQRYGKYDVSLLREVPQKFESRGSRIIYEGHRLLIGRGIDEKTHPKGKIIARFETDKFCFTNSIHGIKLTNAEDWRYKCILGILWSSLSRYYFFMTSGSWGMWHNDIRLNELLNLPIRLPEDGSLKKEIINIVDELRDSTPNENEFGLFMNTRDKNNANRLRELEGELDAAVFKLYELSEPEIDLINDLCDVGIEYFYFASKSSASKALTQNSPVIREYLEAFSEIWNQELDKDSEFSYEIIIPQNGIGMIAAIFSLQHTRNAPSEQVITSDYNRWDELLKDESLFTYPLGSRRIYVDGILRVVTDKEIVIIKRNEVRLWTRSMAREDAEATLVQAMNRKPIK